MHGSCRECQLQPCIEAAGRVLLCKAAAGQKAMHGGGREGPAADMHGSRESQAMQGSSSKGQLQQCMAAAERGQLLTCMATVERGEPGQAAVWGDGWDAAMVGSTNDKTAAMNSHHSKDRGLETCCRHASASGMFSLIGKIKLRVGAT
eukprot:364724-Chlamydomonas_euryale.AAC.4